MIKNLFLNHRGKPTIANKEHCTYAEASNIGLLYNADEFSSETVEELEELLQNDGKAVAKIGYVEKPIEDPLIFNRKDISITGKIKKEQLEFFINQPFDFLISLDTSCNMNYKYVLALSKATCKVGFETEEYYDRLQLSLKMDENKVTAVTSIVKYLKMI